ncbi:albusnodin/ikarugamycin family macrolactam cyclase [Streptomyces sp. NPDC055089]
MIFGGFSTPRGTGPLPPGSQPVSVGARTWCTEDVSARVVSSTAGYRRIIALGTCGASRADLDDLLGRPLPDDVAWRWPGAYAVVEEREDAVLIHTDPASAYPVYGARLREGWAWCTSSRLLAALQGSEVDPKRLAASVLLPSVPALAGHRTFFASVKQLPPGSRIELPADAQPFRSTTTWHPAPVSGPSAPRRLREALAASVSLRVTNDPDLSSDLSGGLDSTSIAVLAAQALPAGKRLPAVTIHPDGDFEGADLRYARLTAAANRDRMVHLLLPLGTEHLPYTAITTVPATDEPVPSTLTRARLTGQMRWMRTHLGAGTHLTGDGGDSVLFQPPLHLADLIRHRRRRQAAGEAVGWARLRHDTPLSLLRDAHRAARLTRHEALQQLSREVGSPDRHDHGHVRWFPLVPFPSWATPAARRLLVDAADEAARAKDLLPELDSSVRALVDEVREIARSATADVALADESGIRLHNPFLDPRVVTAVLTVPLEQRPAVHAYKPVLRSAMASLLPAEVTARNTKGSFDADHFTGMRANLPDLLDLADGHLAGLGLIDPGRFRTKLREAAAGIPTPLASIEQALTAEAWLRAHHRAPHPAWNRSAEAHHG